MFVSCGFVHYLVCRSGPLDTLMMFTTTISVSSIYRTSSVVIVHIIWLYITIVVISFSIIVSCTFISLLFVTFSIMYSRAGSSVSVVSPTQLVLLTTVTKVTHSKRTFVTTG